MAFRLFSGPLATPTTVLANDTIVVDRTALVGVADNTAFGSSGINNNATMRVDGSVVGSIHGIDLRGNVAGIGNNRVDVGKDGIVSGGVIGILMGEIADGPSTGNSIVNWGQIHGQTFSGLFLNNTDGAKIQNHGQISSFGANAVLITNGATEVDVVNTGDISGQSNGISFEAGSTGMVRNSGTISSSATSAIQGAATIINSGLIQGTGQTIVAATSVSNAGEIVGRVESTTGDVVNTGLIHGQGNGSLINVAANVDNSGTLVGDVANIVGDVTNSGLVQGQVNSLENLVNTGQILGFVANVRGDVTNSGHIGGDVFFNNSANIFDGVGGTVSGEVVGFGGNDTYIIDDSGIKILEVAGEGRDTVQSFVSYSLAAELEDLMLMGDENINGNGNQLANVLTGNSGDNRMNANEGVDTVRGLGGDDWLHGGSDRDTMFGGSGDDVMQGGTENDVLAGNNGDDIIFGGDGNDKLNGGDDDDRLYGGNNNDELRGGNGDDVLVGGAGRDNLFGGTGRDVFVFSHQNDSPSGQSPDVIRDFDIGIDRIRLSAMTSDPMELIFGGPFSFSGPSARVVTAANNTKVFVDVDGDRSADFSVTLLGATGLDAGDFLM